VTTLGGLGPFTLFVPIDAVFDRLSVDQQVALSADSATIANMLMYHIVPGYYTTDERPSPSAHLSLQVSLEVIS
jgi:uncharacterized surface protein with fasciclin (FAS1) repeats